jgi:hypothetical protein
LNQGRLSSIIATILGACSTRTKNLNELSTPIIPHDDAIAQQEILRRSGTRCTRQAIFEDDLQGNWHFALASGFIPELARLTNREETSGTPANPSDFVRR